MALFVPITMATLNPTAPRGETIVKMTNHSQEICIVPKKYPDASYDSKDLKVEKELCSYGSTENVAFCAKMNSTNPGIDIYSLPEGMTEQQLEAKSCRLSQAKKGAGKDDDDSQEAKKIAKYKYSVSCSYTPSLLSYYHISRILGNIEQVPVAVIRTMDVNRQKQIGLAGIAAMKGNPRLSLITQNWQAVVSNLSSPSTSSKRQNLFTDDLTQTYGALQEKPKNDEFYKEMYFPARGSETRADAFRESSPIYHMLANPHQLREMVGNEWNAKNLQVVLQMQNVADMIVLDTVLSQEDRFGNINYTNTYYFVDHSNGAKVVSKNKMDNDEAKSNGALVVKQMILKDNDCGVSRENRAKKAHLLEGLSHINPETYSRLLKLKNDLSKQETHDFFRNEALMTESDYSLFKQNLIQAVQTLQNACHQGRMQLDLDLNAHFLNTPVHQSCD